MQFLAVTREGSQNLGYKTKICLKTRSFMYK